ncbi:MAG TPA: (Fe-S)-binding protein, partial [Dehalococcoidia bacterium]|nr:(Fe-S)-binding protein [Dehalococcoidia bacterium]
MQDQTYPHIRRSGRFRLILLAVFSVAWWQWFIAISAVSAGAVVAGDELGFTEPQREVFWNITGGWSVYLMLALLVGVLLYGPYRRLQLWMLGRPGTVTTNLNLRKRILNLFTQGLTTRRLPRYTYGGIMHTCIFVSFIALTIITLILAVDDDTPLDFLHGDFYLWYSAAGDFFGIVGLVGVGMAVFARHTSAPAEMKRVRWEQRHQDDIIIFGLGALLLSGLLAEAMRVGATELHQHSDWARWSFVAYGISGPLDAAGVSRDGFEAAHLVFWWFHVPAAFVWLAYIGYSKLGHILYAPANSFLKTTDAYGKLPAITDFEERETFGVGRIQDFTWKQLFELDVCVRCGRCTDNCPAAIAGQPLSPMHIIQDLKEHMNRVGPSLLTAEAVSGNGNGAHEHEFEPMVGGAVRDEALWACRTCGACVQECPVFIEHIPTIVDMRRWLVMDEARMPETVQGTLMNLEQRGHPWRGTALTRTSW